MGVIFVYYSALQLNNCRFIQFQQVSGDNQNIIMHNCICLFGVAVDLIWTADVVCGSFISSSQLCSLFSLLFCMINILI